MYRDCRKEATVSLLTASEELGHSKETLVEIEYKEREAPASTVAKMVRLYGGNSKLARWHCSHGCPVGKILGIRYCEESEAARAGMKLLNNLKKIDKDRLVDLLEDGQITPDEYDALDEILENVRNINESGIALKLAKEKDTLQQQDAFRAHE